MLMKQSGPASRPFLPSCAFAALTRGVSPSAHLAQGTSVESVSSSRHRPKVEILAAKILSLETSCHSGNKVNEDFPWRPSSKETWKGLAAIEPPFFPDFRSVSNSETTRATSRSTPAAFLLGRRECRPSIETERGTTERRPDQAGTKVGAAVLHWWVVMLSFIPGSWCVEVVSSLPTECLGGDNLMRSTRHGGGQMLGRTVE